MKRYIDENIKANEDAIIRENNGPEIVVKLYDNIGIDWMYYYGKSNASGGILVDDTILHNLLNKADSKVIARNANSKIYDIRIKNAVKGEDLNMVIESVGRYRIGDNMNNNIVLGINDKFFKDADVSDKYFVLTAHNKWYRDTEEKRIDLVDNKPLAYLRRNLNQLKQDNALVYFTSEAMRKAYREDVKTFAKLFDGSEERDLFNVKKEHITSVKFKDSLYKKTYEFLPDPSGAYWILNRINDFYAGNNRVIYQPDNNEYITPTIVDCVANIYENV